MSFPVDGERHDHRPRIDDRAFRLGDACLRGNETSAPHDDLSPVDGSGYAFSRSSRPPSQGPAGRCRAPVLLRRSPVRSGASRPDRGPQRNTGPRPRTYSPCLSIDTICGRPSVSVPVLSRISVLIRASASSGLAPLIRTPKCAARDRPATKATGTARISGQGVATTRTATARIGSPVNHQAAVASATVTVRNSSD